MFAHTFVYGFVNSVILVLVALGFNLTFGISGIANFAYGALYIMSALLCWLFFNVIGLPFILAVLFEIAVTVVSRRVTHRVGVGVHRWHCKR